MPAGEGAYGKVYAGLNQFTGELMAVKALQLGRGNSGAASAHLQEVMKVRCLPPRGEGLVSGVEVTASCCCLHPWVQPGHVFVHTSTKHPPP
jgi:hypothetical protein